MLEDKKNNNNKIRIKDIADSLGVSTATVSNVIHGKTKKISDKTVEKVQEMIEKSGYIPNMAAVLLAQNSSKIVCVVLSDDTKYERQMLQDPFINTLLDGISKSLEQHGYFMMLKREQELQNIVQYASMWNMAGMVLVGYCEQDYNSLRRKMHIPFVVVDGYVKSAQQYSNVGIDNFNGGYQVGKYLLSMGHRKIAFLSDNDLSGDHERYEGFKSAMVESEVETLQEDFKMLSMIKEERYLYYNKLLEYRKKYTAAFCASDVYAIEVMNFLIDHGIGVPEDISIIGFDDIPSAVFVRPTLTTVSQDILQRGYSAVDILISIIEEKIENVNLIHPVKLIIRDSVRKI